MVISVQKKNISMSLLLLFIVLGSFNTAKAAGVDLLCPQIFEDGENIITCKINKTAIEEAHCSSKYKAVTFEWNTNSGKSVACRTVYNPAQECFSREQNRPGSCWCEEASGEIFTYKFSYMANSTHDRGKQLECNLCVLPQKYLNSNISEGCTNIRFDFHKKKKKTDIESEHPLNSIEEEKKSNRPEQNGH